MRRSEAIKTIEAILYHNDYESASLDYWSFASLILSKLETLGMKPPIIQEDVIIDPLLGPVRLSARKWEDET